MESTLLVLAALACPLGMAAMGGAAWLGGKLWSRSADKTDQRPDATT